MNITRVVVNNKEIQPPYEVNFEAGASRIAWSIYASDFDDWAFGDDPIAKATFEIKGVRSVDAVVENYPVGQNPTYWAANPTVYPVTEPGVLQLKSLWTSSGKLRWMNPNS